jgi:hypothetical protein
MKKIVLRNLPPEIQLAIKRKALNEDLSREEAVVELIRDAEPNTLFATMSHHEVAGDGRGRSVLAADSSRACVSS